MYGAAPKVKGAGSMPGARAPVMRRGMSGPGNPMKAPIKRPMGGMTPPQISAVPPVAPAAPMPRGVIGGNMKGRA